MWQQPLPKSPQLITNQHIVVSQKTVTLINAVKPSQHTPNWLLRGDRITREFRPLRVCVQVLFVYNSERN